MNRDDNPRQRFSFVFIAALLMVLTDFVFSPTIVVHDSRPEIQDKIYEHSEIEDFETGQALLEEKPADENFAQPGSLGIDIPQPEAIKNNAESLAKIIQQPASLKIEKNIIPPSPAPRPVIEGKGLVAIIIDDMGMDRKHSLQAIDLPGPLTLSFLPYAPLLPETTKSALAKGKELLIHVPMQPVNPRLNPGPLALRDDMSAEALDAALEHSFNAFDGYVGINNHMGSKLTQNKWAMDRVMEALAKRNLIFIDSVTIASSIAAQEAAAYGLAYNSRDVFLDNEDSKEFVMGALYDLEKVAKRRGYAIAIGHPKESTIEALKEWLPEMKKRGLTLVPVSRLARKPPSSMPTSVAFPKESFGPFQPQAPQP